MNKFGEIMLYDSKAYCRFMSMTSVFIGVKKDIH